jgi:hypothetical protein
MAVELRCPECRSKLRLSQAPEPESEIECPKCGNVFTSDRNLIRKNTSDDEDVEGDKPMKNSETVAENKSSSPAKKNDKTKANDKPFRRKKRRAKKRKANPVVVWSIVGGGVVALIFVIVVLVLTLGRKSVTQQMMMYLPEECDEVTGLNIGHLQKYPDFYRACESQMVGKGFMKAADVLGAALGSDGKTVLDYVMQGVGKSSEGTPVEATVLRTKTEFDTGLLKKIPGAKEYSAGGVKYYTIDDIPELKYPGLRVFAPTNRIVVFCRGDISESKFKTMLSGNQDNPDAAPYKRAGPLIKQVTRGTVWQFMLYGRSVSKPTPNIPKDGAKGESDEDAFKKVLVDTVGSAQGCGFKASVGSRDVRGEWVIWFKDSDAPYNLAKKWKDTEWIKDDEKAPPRWWGLMANKSGGGKTASNAVKDNLSFRSSGEIFSVRASLETNVLKLGVGQLVSAFTGVQGGRMGPGGSGPGPGMPNMTNGPGMSGGSQGGPPGGSQGGPPGGQPNAPGGKPPGKS